MENSFCSMILIPADDFEQSPQALLDFVVGWSIGDHGQLMNSKWICCIWTMAIPWLWFNAFSVNEHWVEPFPTALWHLLITSLNFKGHAQSQSFKIKPISESEHANIHCWKMHSLQKNEIYNRKLSKTIECETAFSARSQRVGWRMDSIGWLLQQIFSQFMTGCDIVVLSHL